MQQKIQELTEKIYREGVQKGEARSKEIEQDAQKKAEKILADAKTQAEKIVEDARKEAQELKRTVESEIKLSGAQALSSLQQEVVEMITARALDDSVSAVLSDGDVIKEFIGTIVSQWKAQSDEPFTLSCVLPEDKKEELDKSVAATVKKILGTEATCSFPRGVKGGFQIIHREQGYKISLTDEDFKEFFKEYVRPKTKSLLFGGE